MFKKSYGYFLFLNEILNSELKSRFFFYINHVYYIIPIKILYYLYIKVCAKVSSRVQVIYILIFVSSRNNSSDNKGTSNKSHVKPTIDYFDKRRPVAVNSSGIVPLGRAHTGGNPLNISLNPRLVTHQCTLYHA